MCEPLLRARRQGPYGRCTAKQRDELTPFQLIKWHPSPRSREVVQRSDIAKISQGLVELCDNLSWRDQPEVSSGPWTAPNIQLRRLLRAPMATLTTKA
jgi:hypothetical protein